MTHTWDSRFNSVTVRKPSWRDNLIYDEEVRRVAEPGLRKPLEDCDSWLDLSQPAWPVELTRPWSPRHAIKRLGVEIVPFDEETQPEWTKGITVGNRIAIRPDYADRLHVLKHELAHVVLRHTYLPDPLGRDPEDPIREVQAESAAYLSMTYAGAATAALHAYVRVYNWKHTTKAGRWMNKEERDQCFEAAQIVITAGRPDNRPVILQRNQP